MGRLQIEIDGELDKALTTAATQRRTSKSALVRQAVAARYMPGAQQSDALKRMAGMLPAHPDDARSIDDVVYERP